MSDSPVSADSKLVFIDDTQPGITRRPRKDGWDYFDPAGAQIADEALITRLASVALPPAYRDAWYCPDANGHLLATGIDARGRKQYRYHPDFRKQQESAKFDGLMQFGVSLPLIRRRVEADLARSDLGRDRAVAAVVRLLDTGTIRVGNEAYARLNKSFGATTLRKRHADLRGVTLRLNFRGKSGKMHNLRLTDKALLRFVRRLHDLPGQHLFQFVDAAGTPHPVGSSDVNAYLHETMGSAFSAKHFRTWGGSVTAFAALAASREVLKLRDVLETVAQTLGNTPAIARKSYIHPDLLAIAGDKAAQVQLRDELKLPRKTRWMSRHERGLVEFLDGIPATR
ncbi:MAG: DNA topoisomerase IB [Pseudomonadota bacterium]|nr:DNA topoisomerase IB [Pseudomonadota bacterium]